MRVSGKGETSGQRTAQRLGKSSANQARRKAQDTGREREREELGCHCLGSDYIAFNEVRRRGLYVTSELR